MLSESRHLEPSRGARGRNAVRERASLRDALRWVQIHDAVLAAVGCAFLAWWRPGPVLLLALAHFALSAFALALVARDRLTPAIALATIGKFPIYVSGAWFCGPAAEVQWFLVSSLPWYFLVGRGPARWVLPVGLTVHFIAFFGLEAADVAGAWSGVLTLEEQHGIAWIALALAVLHVALGVGQVLQDARAGEAELRRARDAAVDAAESRAAFLRTMCHEIRSPLSEVVSLDDLLVRQRLTDEGRSLASEALGSAAHLLQILDDVLDLSRLDAHVEQPQDAPFDLPEAVGQVLRIARVRADAQGLRLQASLDLAGRDVRLGDARRIKQVLLNLVSNAVKFTPSGHVIVSAQAVDARRVRLSVRDTGVGMSPEQVHRLFEAYEQGDPSIARTHGGSGLGLAVAQHVVEALGSSIQVRTQRGQGSDFSFVVDLPPAALPEAAAPSSEPSTGAAWRVLVADDNPTNRMVLRRMLEDHGHEVLEARDGREAVERWRVGAVDRILMDVQMPGMDGLEATRAIRDEERRRGLGPTPIVAVTANALSGDEERCLDAGMSGYLAKPVGREALLGALRRVGRRRVVAAC